MCGVLAIFDPRRDPRRFAVTEALRTLAHRGPDGEGVWYSPDGHCVLAHTRLAMVDLSQGQQPLVSSGQLFACVLNGEIYDLGNEWRGELTKLGAVFHTRSDAELLLHGYAQSGAKVFAKLRGEYAAIVYDTERHELHLARDPFGVKPLVYAWIDGALCVASEAKALFALGHPPEWNPEAVRCAMQWQYLLPTQSLFAGVTSLAPAQQLRQTLERTEVQQTPWQEHFRARMHERMDSFAGDEEAVLGAVREAVTVRMRGDVRLGTYLSGGIDSSTVSALAAETTDAPLPVFSLGFSESSESDVPSKSDESWLAESFAQARRMDFHLVTNSPLELVENTSAAAVSAEGLTINGHLAAKWKLSAAVHRAGLKGVLVGEGADELFLGYPHLLLDWVLSHPQTPGTTPETSSQQDIAQELLRRFGPEVAVMATSANEPEIAGLMARWGAVPSWMHAKYARGRLQQPLLHPSVRFASAQVAVETIASVVERAELRSSSPVEVAALSWSRLALSGYILKTLGDGTEMAHSVEGRVPFLDPFVALTAWKFAPETHLRGDCEKSLLRRALRSVVGPTIAERRKRALVSPFAVRDPKAHDAFQQRLRSADGCPSWVDRERVTEWLDSLASGSATERASHDPTLFMLLSAGALERAFSLQIKAQG